MALEPPFLFDPRRTIQLQGFSGQAATTTLHDASHANQGIVQIDAGSLAVYAGVLSMAQSGASPGTYQKVTVDAKGGVIAGANLAATDLPGHTHAASDIVSGELPHKIQKDGTDVGTRRALNSVRGNRVSVAADDDPANDRISVTISASPPEAGEITNALGYILYAAHLAGPTKITLTTSW